jgi:hypothetical protein
VTPLPAHGSATSCKARSTALGGVPSLRTGRSISRIEGPRVLAVKRATGLRCHGIRAHFTTALVGRTMPRRPTRVEIVPMCCGDLQAVELLAVVACGRRYRRVAAEIAHRPHGHASTSLDAYSCRRPSQRRVMRLNSARHGDVSAVQPYPFQAGDRPRSVLVSRPQRNVDRLGESIAPVFEDVFGYRQVRREWPGQID